MAAHSNSIPQNYADFEIAYYNNRGLPHPPHKMNINNHPYLYPDAGFFMIANGLQPSTGGQIGNQHGLPYDPTWQGKPQGDNVAEANLSVSSPLGPHPHTKEPVDDLKIEEKRRRNLPNPFKTRPF